MKKIFTLFLSFIMVLCLFNGITVSATEVASGTCGNNLTWVLDEDGVLTVSGEGEIPDYDETWNEYRNSIESLILEEGVTRIGDNVFASCINLASIKFPATMKSIGMRTFSSCKGLTTIELPEGFTSIGSMAFYNCTSLCDITIPKSLKSIGSSAFEGCSSLTDVYYKDSSKQWQNIDMGRFNGELITSNIHFTASEVVMASGTCGDNLTWVLYDDGILHISGEGDMVDYNSSDNRAPWYAYENSVKIAIIEDGVTSLGYAAFRNCDSLTEVKLPEGIKSLGDAAFKYCYALKTINLPDSIEDIGYAAFGYCEALVTIKLPLGITEIDGETFYNCISLKEITIPDNVARISDYAFKGCKAVATVNVSDTVESIGKQAFNNCTAIKDVYYDGTKAMWEAVAIGTDNAPLLNATLHFNLIISGNVVSFGDVTKDVTVELLKDGEVVCTKTVTGKNGTYTFENVAEGDFVIRVSKTKHCPREYAVSVYDDVVTDVSIQLYGDVTGDGIINNADALQINRKNSNQLSVFDSGDESIKTYRLITGNVTAITATDTVVNNADVLQINRANANLTSVFDRLA